MDETFPDFLVCPVTHSALRREGDFLVAQTGGLKYPIKEGLPVLLPDAAILPEGYRTLAAFKAAMKTGNPAEGRGSST